MFSLLIALATMFGASPLKKNGDVEHFYEEVLCEAGMDSYEYGVDVTPLVKTLDNDKTLKITDFNREYFFGTLRGDATTWNSKGECLNSHCHYTDDLEYSELWLIKP